MRGGGRAIIAIAYCLWPIACSHTSPFEAPSHATDEPLTPGAHPVRLTYNRGHDQDASWLPDGSGFVYTTERFRYDESDWCLAQMPPSGGRIARRLCHSGAGSEDSVDAYRSGAVSAEGRVLLFRASGPRGTLGASLKELLVTRWSGPPLSLAVIQALPFSLSGGARPFTGLSHLRWLDETRFVFRGDLNSVRTFDFLPPESVATGRNLVLGEIGGNGVTLSIIPATDYASSVAVLSSDEIIYTRGGDSKVYRRRLSTGDTATIWDFGGPIARGVQISGSRLMAIVGGSAVFTYDGVFQDSALIDDGGFLRSVDLDSRASGFVDQFALYRDPALSPDGRRVIVESVARAPDLFLYVLP